MTWVDNAPLQREAWAEFRTARKRLGKVSADLHRHEEVDTPAFDQWFYQTFPVQITQLRTLQEEVYTKGKQVAMVQSLGYLTGSSPKRLWRELKEREKNPDLFAGGASFFEEQRKKFFGNVAGEDEKSAHEDDADPEERHSSQQTEYKSGSRESMPDDPAERKGAGLPNDVKAIYRRLVQRLHPDRGGEWTLKRQRLWHDVQQAWQQADVDWLARLEVEWETANDLLGPTSPLGRLRQAIEELHGARRDVEKKLRRYRAASSWRFTLREAKRAELQSEIEEDLANDLAHLAGQLRYLDATIKAWERSERPSKRPCA